MLWLFRAAEIIDFSCELSSKNVLVKFLVKVAAKSYTLFC